MCADVVYCIGDLDVCPPRNSVALCCRRRTAPWQGILPARRSRSMGQEVNSLWPSTCLSRLAGGRRPAFAYSCGPRSRCPGAWQCARFARVLPSGRPGRQRCPELLVRVNGVRAPGGEHALPTTFACLPAFCRPSESHGLGGVVGLRVWREHSAAAGADLRQMRRHLDHGLERRRCTLEGRFPERERSALRDGKYAAARDAGGSEIAGSARGGARGPCSHVVRCAQREKRHPERIEHAD